MRSEEARLAYESGQWEAWNRVLNLLNTYDTNEIDKKDLYKVILEFRPRILPLPLK